MSVPALQAEPFQENSRTRPELTVPTYRRLTPSLRPRPTRLELFCALVVPIWLTDQLAPVTTISEIGLEWERAPLVPTIVTGYVPEGVLGCVEMVTVLSCAGSTGLGLNEAVVPVGSPCAESVIGLLNA